jgi:cellulose synthase/poly-beta-1,6-N-acetylglucosamine synthase-like glycosyltransferase
MTTSHTDATHSTGFFAALFDFSFTSFITLKFLKVIYALLVAMILLGGIVFLVAALSQGGAYILVGLVIAPLVTLVYLIFARVALESVAMFFRIGENTTLMAAHAGGTTTALGGPPSPGPIPGA